MKIVQKLLLIIFSMIMGVVLLFGGAGLYVYLNMNKPGSMQGIQKIIPDSFPIKWDNELLNMSILEYLQFTASSFANLGDARIGDLERIVGADVLSNLLQSNTGIDKQLYKTSTLGNLSKTLTENLTLEKMRDNFGFEFGELPLFSNEEFLSSPLNMAFSNMTDYNLDQFIEITYDEDATPEKPASRILLQKLGKEPVSTLSASLDDTINKSKIHELVTITETSSLILQNLKDSTVENLDQSIKNLVLKDMIVVNESSHIVIKKLQNLTVGQLSDSAMTKALIDEVKLGELIEINTSSHRLLQSLADTDIANLSNKVNELTVIEVFDNVDQGALSMISPDTKLADIPNELGDAIPNTSLYHLKKAGIFNINEPADKFGKVKVYNATMQDAVSQFSDAIAQPEGELIIFKRNIVYLYDNETLYNSEKTNANPYGGADSSITNFLYTYYSQIGTFSKFFNIIEIDISLVDQNADGYYIITDELLSTMDSGNRIKNGTEVVLQRGVNIILEGDSTPENTYDSIISISSYYESAAVLQPSFISADIGSMHGIIRIGNDIKIENRIGGYIYIRGPEGSIQTDTDRDGTFTNIDLLDPSTYPTIECLLIKDQHVNPSLDPEPNILFEIFIDE